MAWKNILKNYKPLAHNQQAKKVMRADLPHGQRPLNPETGGQQYRSQEQRQGNYMESQGKDLVSSETNPDGTPLTPQQKLQRIKDGTYSE
tara:strand:+ start:541 stop:810 length:270 start_codon:yes stop_codon:yes gene_type:complete